MIVHTPDTYTVSLRYVYADVLQGDQVGEKTYHKLCTEKASLHYVYANVLSVDLIDENTCCKLYTEKVSLQCGYEDGSSEHQTA